MSLSLFCYNCNFWIWKWKLIRIFQSNYVTKDCVFHCVRLTVCLIPLFAGSAESGHPHCAVRRSGPCGEELISVAKSHLKENGSRSSPKKLWDDCSFGQKSVCNLLWYNVNVCYFKQQSFGDNCYSAIYYKCWL